MEENFQLPQKQSILPKIPKPNKNKISIVKWVYLTIFGALFLTILVVIYFQFIAPKLKKLPPKEIKQSTSSAKPQTDTFTIGYVNAPEGLFLRDKPSSDANQIVLLPNATKLQIISREDNWLFVQAQTKGFVSKDFVTGSKPSGLVLLVFDDNLSPFTFLYPEIYKITLTKTDTSLEYSFTGNDSVGGFSVETVPNLATIGNYALINYPGDKVGACSLQISTTNKECEELTGDNGTIYLVLNNSTLYKISYLKTVGGLLTDLNNIVFYSLYFK